MYGKKLHGAQPSVGGRGRRDRAGAVTHMREESSMSVTRTAHAPGSAAERSPASRERAPILPRPGGIGRTSISEPAMIPPAVRAVRYGKGP